MKRALMVFILITILIVLYLFGYKEWSASSSLKELCNSAVKTKDINKIIKNAESLNLGVATYAGTENIVISGGWMNACFITVNNQKIVSAKYEQD